MENPLQNIRAPWISPDGHILMEKLPIDSTLENSLHPNFEQFSDACRILQSMFLHGKSGAAIFLLGLLRHYQDDIRRSTEIVNALSGYKTKPCAQALLAELRRVKNSNSTRKYINTLLKALSYFPLELVEDGLSNLADDKTFTPKMRARFKSILKDTHKNDDDVFFGVGYDDNC
ncbi:MAG: hypothetical protein HW380_2128 [Magnetococcales bacterium]|nr:hypothetical protein [Magnetococcales bacterium]